MKRPFHRKLSDQSFERMNATSDCTPLTIVMDGKWDINSSGNGIERQMYRSILDDAPPIHYTMDGEPVTNPVLIIVISRLMSRYSSFCTHEDFMEDPKFVVNADWDELYRYYQTTKQVPNRYTETLVIRSKELQEWFHERVRRDVLDEQERYDERLERRREKDALLESNYRIEMEEREVWGDRSREYFRF